MRLRRIVMSVMILALALFASASLDSVPRVRASSKSFTVSVTPATSAFQAGSSATTTITITSVDSFKGTVALTATVSPSVVNGPRTTLTPDFVILKPDRSATSSLTVSSKPETPAGLYTITVTASGGGTSQTNSFTAAVTPITVPIAGSGTFTGVTLVTQGTLSVDSPSTNLTLSGTVSVTATNSTTGAILFSKSYSIVRLPMVSTSNGAFQVKFLLDVAVSPYHLSSNVVVTLQSGSAASSSVGITRNVDVNLDGIVNVVDLGIVQAASGCSIGSSCYNPRADLNADGIVNIIDIAIVNDFLGSKDFTA